MSGIPDFTDADRWVVETALKEYGRGFEPQALTARAFADPAPDLSRSFSRESG